MKKLIAIIAPVLFIIACKNVDQFRAPIEALSADWEKSTTAVTEAGSMLASAQMSLANLKDSFTVDPKMKLTPEVMATMDSMKLAFTTQMGGFEVLAQEITTLSGTWKEMSDKLTSIKEGMSSGKLEGDVMAQINELKTASMDATAKADAWKSKIDAAKNTGMMAYEMFKQSMVKK